MLRSYWEKTVTVFCFLATVLAFLLPSGAGLAWCAVASLLVLCAMISRRRWQTRWERRGTALFKGLSQPSYLAWQQATLESLYGGLLEIATVFGRRYPAAIMRPTAGWQYPFANLCTLTSTSLPKTEVDKQQADYIQMIGRSLKWPKMRGFALRRVERDAEGQVGRLEIGITTFYHNVITCHILEWELYRDYQRLSSRRDPHVLAGALSDLPRRAKYHNGRSADVALLEPAFAYPLISVQAMVVFRDARSVNVPVWRVVLARRSEDVIVKPGYFQFQPAGGFEVYGTEACDDVTEFELRQGCNVTMALFREYAEELFDAKHLQVRTDGRDPRSVLADPNVMRLTDLLQRGAAYVDYLGVCIDLSLLRHELSFLILIDDDDWTRNALLGSWEARNIFTPIVSELRQVLAGGVLHGSSAALLQLAMESERLRALGIAAEMEAVSQ